MPSVARATDGAAPKRPAKVLGRRTSPSMAKVNTTTPPTMKRRRYSVISLLPEFRQQPVGSVDQILARWRHLRDRLEGARPVFDRHAIVVRTGRRVCTFLTHTCRPG